MRLTVFALAFFAAAPLPAAAEICQDKICFEAEKEITGAKVPARSTALVKYVGFDLYVVALYVPQGAESIAEVLDARTPKSLVLHYLRKIRKDQIIHGGERVLRRNKEVPYSSIEEKVGQINAVYQDVAKGDRYELRYEPGKGTSLYFNGNLKTTVPGEDFQKAYLGIWLGEDPLQKKVRDRLLGPGGQKGPA